MPELRLQSQSQVIWSRFQIIRLFRRFIRDEKNVSIEFDDDEKLLLTQALNLNARTNRVAFAYGDHKRTNSDLLRSERLLFSIEEGLQTYRFTSAKARDFLLRGKPAFQVALPEAVLLTDRRKEQRIQVPKFSSPPVWLHLPDGTEVQGQLSDVSEGGIGLIGLQVNTPLRKGMVLRCEIDLRPGGSVMLDVEVRYVRRLEGAGRRVGFRLRSANPEFARLVKAFTVEV
jgi:c-di-GMP-binding flagellar brake protein YcgR